jgi:outer membrane receptor protein involved in Fe transport
LKFEILLFMRSAMWSVPTRYSKHLFLYITFVLSFAFLISIGNLEAATTGKIQGRVVDIKTTEGIIGANVVIPNNGAATDLDGYFTIMNVPPGVYDVVISCVGYHELTIVDVFVASDTPTKIEPVLTPDRLTAPEVIVIFEPKQVVLGESAKANRVSKKTLENVGIENVKDILKIASGFRVDDENKIHVRGSRAADVAIVVEGVDLRDRLVDTQVNINLSSGGIEEVTLLTGGFAAEYGQVMGGVIQVTTSEGKSSYYTGRFEYQTDQIIETYSFNTDQAQFAFGGPVPYTKDLLGEPVTFYLTTMGGLTDTYVGFDVDHEANDYLGFGIDLPERQNNNYQSTLKLAYQLTPKQKISLYTSTSYQQWDIYPNGEGGISGNYGYGYKYNLENRPWAWNKRFANTLSYTHQINEKLFYELKFIVYRTQSKVQPRGKTPGEFTLLDDIEDTFAQASDRNSNGTLDSDEYLDSDGDGFMDGYWDANNNRIFDGGGEGYEDLNMNGRWDRGEDWVDLNGNKIYDAAEPWTDVVNPLTGENNIGVYDLWDNYSDINGNGRWDPSEPQLPEQDWNGNGQWDGERFVDANNNGVYDPWEEWDDLDGDYLWDDNEPFTDVNGNGKFDYSEGYDDSNQNGKVDRRDLAVRSAGGTDENEPFIDGDFWWNTGEPFIDEPDPISGEYNGRWDQGEVWFDLPTSSNVQTYAGVSYIGEEMVLNGRYDGPNFFNGNPVFDEYELFTKPANWSFNSDKSRPVEYSFSEEARGADWPVDLLTYDRAYSTWINRTIHDIQAPVFDMRNFDVEEDEEWFLDYNNDGEWSRVDGFLNPGVWDATAFWQDRVSTEYKLKLDVQSQLNRFHELKSGIEFSYRDVNMQSIQQPDLAYDGEAKLPDGSLWPDRGGIRDFYNYNPTEGAAYLQDKMDFEGLIVNVGLRGDFVIHDPKVVREFRDRVSNDEPGAIYANRGTYRLSPRLGISHPISEQSKLYFNYGHFYQAPNFQYFYKSATANFDANTAIGNPNLEYEKTIQYELGVNTQLSDDFVIDISGYYKDQYDMISTQDERWKNLTLDRYANIDYGRMRGFEMSLEKRPSNHYAFNFNYDFSFAYGKASSQQEAQNARLSNVPYNYNEHPLGWDETHKLNSYMTVRYGKNDFPHIFGFKMPDNWQMTLQWEFGSGLPYTPSIYTTGIDDANLILPNSARRPWHEKTTFKVEKFYTIGRSSEDTNTRDSELIIGLTISNLFNRKNVSSVYGQTGSPTEPVHPDNPAYNPGNNLQEFDSNPRNYGPGRNVILRIGFSF